MHPFGWAVQAVVTRKHFPFPLPTRLQKKGRTGLSLSVASYLKLRCSLFFFFEKLAQL